MSGKKHVLGLELRVGTGFVKKNVLKQKVRAGVTIRGKIIPPSERDAEDE